MYQKSSALDPLIREANAPRKELIYFALTSSNGWWVPGYNPWEWTLHIAINPDTKEYNDLVTVREAEVEKLPIGTVEIPEDGLNALINLASDTKYLSLTQAIVYRCDACDGGSQTIESYINGTHRKLWCYFQHPLRDGIIELKSRKKGVESVPFKTGLEMFGDLVDPVIVSHYEVEIQDRRDETRAREFVEAQNWKFAKTMPQIPHYYCLKGLCPDPKEFEWFVDYMLRKSVSGEFYGKTFQYFYLDKWKYWIMDEYPAKCNLINREFQE